MKSISHYAVVAPGNVSELAVPAIPANKTYTICCIDFTCPTANKSGVVIYWNGTAVSNIRVAAQSDKQLIFPGTGIVIEGNGSSQMTISCDNSNGNNQALLGCTIYYED